MEFETYYCFEDDYSESYEVCKVHHRLLEFRGDKLEVELRLLPEVKGHSDGKFNVMFYDRNEQLEDDSRKYFIYANWFEVFRLKWMFGRYWIQSQDGKAQLFLLVLGYILGLLTTVITGTGQTKDEVNELSPKSESDFVQTDTLQTLESDEYNE